MSWLSNKDAIVNDPCDLIGKLYNKPSVTTKGTCRASVGYGFSTQLQDMPRQWQCDTHSLIILACSMRGYTTSKNALEIDQYCVTTNVVVLIHRQ